MLALPPNEGWYVDIPFTYTITDSCAIDDGWSTDEDLMARNIKVAEEGKKQTMLIRGELLSSPEIRHYNTCPIYCTMAED